MNERAKKKKLVADIGIVELFRAITHGTVNRIVYNFLNNSDRYINYTSCTRSQLN